MRRIDITPDACPITFVKVKLELEEMQPGEDLQVRLRDGEPLENVTRSCVAEGHEVLAREHEGAGIWQIVVRAGRPRA